MTATPHTVQSIVEEAVSDVIEIRDQYWVRQLIEQAAQTFWNMSELHDKLESKALRTRNLAERIKALATCVPFEQGSPTIKARRDITSALSIAEEQLLEWEDVNQDSLEWVSAARAIVYATSCGTPHEVHRWIAAAYLHAGRAEALANA